MLIVSPRGIGKNQGEQWDYDGNLVHALQYWRSKWSGEAETSYQWLLSQAGVNQKMAGQRIPARRLISYPEQAHGIRLFETHPELELIVLRLFENQLR